MGVFKRTYNYYFSPKKSFIRRISQILGYIPSDDFLFYKTFIHKSNPLADINNERLEFLGDSILGTVVAEYLFKKYPDKDEGFLTKMRSKIVNRNTLNDLAEKMRLDVLIRYVNKTSLISPSIMGNALEAFVGAIYIEKGYLPTQKFIIQHLVKKYIDIHYLEENDDNYKSQLLEWAQKTKIPVKFQIVERYRKDSRDFFKVGAFVNNELVALGEGYSKKVAEQEASKKSFLQLAKLQISVQNTHSLK